MKNKITVLLLEVLGLRDGTILAKNQRINKLVVEGDSKVISNCMNRKSMAPWMIWSLVLDSWNFITQSNMGAKFNLTF